MVQAVVKSVSSVISAVEDVQQADFDEYNLEFQSGSNWITHALESVKRHIIASNAIEEDSRKRRKAGSISDYQSATTNATEDDKENNHPNVNVDDIDEQKTSSMTMKENEKEAFSPTTTCIDVMSLKVVELRKHLRERGLDTSGLKKILQNRLQEALYRETIDSSLKEAEPDEPVDEEQMEVNEGTKDETSDIVSSAEENKEDSQVGCDKEVDKSLDVEVIEVMETVGNDSDVSMEEGFTEENKIQNSEDVTRKSVEIINVDDDVDMVDDVPVSTKEEEHEEMKDGADDDQEMGMDKIEEEKQSQKISLSHKLLKATRKVFSPNKNKKSPAKPLKEEYANDDMPSNLNKMSINDDLDPSTANAEISKPKRDISSENNSGNQRTQDSKATTSDKRDTKDEIRNGLQSTSKTAPYQQSAIKTTVKHSKVVQATPALSSKKTISNMSSQKKLQSMKEARKLRLDEIRNKVKPKTNQLTSGKKVMSSVMSSQKIKGTDTSDRKREFANQIRQKVAASKNTSHAVTKSSHADSVPQTPAAQQVAEHKEQKSRTLQEQLKKPLSPMETYEMSDRGESDSDDSDYEDNEPKKKIPKWAQREFLRPALERQYLDGPHKIDPDDIFPEVSTCDLEAIFDQKKKRYIKRTSSGNWTKDRVTVHEKLVYKRKMGFQK